MEEKLKVRDFIYLDVERLKSILAQVDEGVTEKLQEAFTETDNDIDRKEGGAFNLFKAISENQYLFQTQKTESRVLHDYLYHHVLKKLNKENEIISIQHSMEEVAIDDYIGQLKDTSFVLISGKSAINDYGFLQKLLNRYNDLMRYLESAQIAAAVDNGTINESQKKQKLNSLTKKEYMAKESREGLNAFIETFFKERTVYKISPFDKFPEFRFVGTLRSEFLRESIDDIIYKYGTRPESSWHMFAQIASIPDQNSKEDGNLFIGGNDLEKAFGHLFTSAREIEKTGLTVVFPEIAVTPIAIYRE